MSTLGFDKYIEPLRVYLAKYRCDLTWECLDVEPCLQYLLAYLGILGIICVCMYV